MSKLQSRLFVVVFVFLQFAGASMPCRALAGQNIIIDGTVYHSVYGNGNAADNGNLPDPSGPTSLVNPPNDNTVTINSGAIVHGQIYGGYALSNSDSTTASSNSVVVSGGTAGGDVHGGYAFGNFDSTTALNNSVVVSGGTVGGDVYGGNAFGNFGSATASNNSVAVSGGTVGSDIYGGYGLLVSPVSISSATGNTITLSGAPDFTKSNIYGGFVRDATHLPIVGMDAFSGNTLNVWNYSGSAVTSVAFMK